MARFLGNVFQTPDQSFMRIMRSQNNSLPLLVAVPLKNRDIFIIDRVEFDRFEDHRK
jgi:hypothetical protein